MMDEDSCILIGFQPADILILLLVMEIISQILIMQSLSESLHTSDQMALIEDALVYYKLG